MCTPTLSKKKIKLPLDFSLKSVILLGMTRKEYMADFKANYRTYYAQFVTPEVKNAVCNYIGLYNVINSKDPHFNDISLNLWDNICLVWPLGTAKKMEELGESFTLAVKVCIFKEAAQQLREEGDKREG